MAKILIVGTERYSINACDFDLMFRNSQHEIVKVLWHANIGKKNWFRNKTKSACPANRNGVHTRLQDHPNESWQHRSELEHKISHTDCDYICIGNGNDDIGKWLQQRIKKKFLFSEYGWMPWHECFYVDDRGTGALSSLRFLPANDLKPTEDRSREVDRIKSMLKGKGQRVEFNNFVYVPLQVDTPTSDGKPDFKFQFTGFRNNREFLSYLSKIIPRGTTVLVKNHPSARQATPVPAGMIDISQMNLDKYELYNRMSAMAAINSTSVLEGVLFQRNVFVYGEDIFTGKGVVHEQVSEGDRFASILRNDPPIEAGRKFIGCLLQRQFYRERWQDKNYVQGHFWNQALTNAG